MSLVKRIAVLSILIYSFILVQTSPSFFVGAQSGNPCEDCNLTYHNCLDIASSSNLMCSLSANDTFSDCVAAASLVANDCLDACENSCAGNQSCLTTCQNGCNDTYNTKLNKCTESYDLKMADCDATYFNAQNACKNSCLSCRQTFGCSTGGGCE
jgi:hypothetical protein